MKKTYNFGLIGHNISYSKSRNIFQAIFKITGVAGSFEDFDVEPGRFVARFAEVAKRGIDGLSVTIPYKKKVLQFLDDIHPVARALEAVNSIAFDSGKLSGFNTDCYGFSLPLRNYSEQLKHGRALVLGCGGGAKAAVYSLYTDYEVKQFIVVGRTQTRLEQFRSSLRRQIRNIDIQPLHLRDLNNDSCPGCDIVVNCTPAGGWNHPDESPLPEQFRLPPGKLYYDLNYNRGNKLLAQAREAGLITIDGSAMLAGQAIRSYEIWTGEQVPFESIYGQVFGE